MDRALSLDGVRQWGQATSTVFDIVNDISVSAWVKPDTVTCSTECNVVSKHLAWGIYIQNGVWFYQFNDGTAWTKVSSGVTARAGEWVHVALTRVKSSGATTFYLNGQPMKTSTYTSALGTGTDTVGTGAWIESSTLSTASLPYDGDIDEIRVWNVVRSQTQIQADMITWGPMDASGLIGYWDFNESSNSVVRNMASGASAATNMTLINRPGRPDVKTVTTSGSNTVVSFPRTYLNAAGGWRSPAGASSMSYLVVGGGGGGGAHVGGGGGGGGVLTGTGTVQSGDVVPVTVGAGGIGGLLADPCSNPCLTSRRSTSGTNSVVDFVSGRVTAIGGGSGGHWNYYDPRSGGSGGGSGHSTPAGAAGTNGQGFAGGSGYPSGSLFGGGGGGAGAVGTTATASLTGNGGAGVSSSITGSALFYGGGGGGAIHTSDATYNPGTGGSGVGGAGTEQTTAKGGNGTTGRGGGGGGAGNTNQARSEGGDGGSGVVVFSYASTGGTCKIDQTLQGEYIVVAFKEVGTCSWSVPANVTAIDYLVVAGGGGGGTRAGGGGGAGGLLTDFARSVSGVSALTVTVGAGGVGGQAIQASGTNGSNSVLSGSGGFATVTAIGGGGGGTGITTAGNGGSGGGAGGSDASTGTSNTVGTGTAGPPRQGNNGGQGRSRDCLGSTSKWCAGGGGGAGSVGGNGASGGAAGSGGDGLILSWITTTTARRLGIGEVSGSYAYFAGGGGGGADDGGTAGLGGVGGGGRGSISNNTAGVDGLDAAGGGGGGSGYHNTNGQSVGGNGGDGVVVLRYTTASTTTFSTVDSAAVLNGSSQYFQVAEGSAFVSRATYTAEAWVYPTSTSCAGGCPIISHDGDYIITIVNSRIVAYIYHTSTGQMNTWSTPVYPIANRWQHIAFVRDGTTASIYLNGDWMGNFTVSGAGRSTYGNQFPLKIGWHYNAQYFAGRIDHVRYWSTARTEAQVETAMHEYTPSTSTGLIAQYDFNGVTGTSVANSAPSAAANTALTAYGSPTYLDVKTLSNVENQNDAVVTFPRSYLTAAGGWTVPASARALSVLAVGGGGGGGDDAGGGGGGGGIRFENGVAVAPGTAVNVKVGQGGRGGSWNTYISGSGQASTVAWGARTYTGNGGAAGERWLGGNQGTPQGGAGGGSSGNGSGSNGANGGNGPQSICSNTISQGTVGGNGPTSSITGTTTNYGGGGGGGFQISWDTTSNTGTVTGRAGGSGGGGQGATWGPLSMIGMGFNGTVNTGGGGGAGHACGSTNNHNRRSGHRADAGDGGPGVVIVRYSPVDACEPVTSRHGVYRVYEFRTVTTCEWSVPTGVASLDYLVVAGGGGGGAYQGVTSGGGGGGAGGVLNNTGLAVSAGQTLTLSVGGGGAGGVVTADSVGASTNGSGTAGADSSLSGSGISTLTAVGGGFGSGNATTLANRNGGNGGSGGGALGSSLVASSTGGTGVAGPPRQGFNGGANDDTCGNERPSGGGGGAGGVGGTASCVGDQSGHGGPGRLVAITGANVVYGGGGGGGASGTGAVAGRGGVGGGGAGGSTIGGDGLDGFGGGGGGAGYNASVDVNVAGGAGGDGVIVLRHVDRTLSVSAGDNQGTAPGVQLGTNPKVVVRDPAGNGIDGIPVTFTVTAGGGSVGTTTVVTTGGGFAETTWTVGASGTQTMTATMAIVDSNTVTFTANISSVTCDANFGAMNFNFANKTVVTAANASNPGFALNDKVLFKDVITSPCDGVSTALDALVTTSALSNATVQAYEANAKSPGASSYFMVDLSVGAGGGYAEFGFQFYEAGTYGSSNRRVALQNVKATGYDIDFNQYQQFSDIDGFTTATDSRLTATRTPASGFPANVKFQGPNGSQADDPRDRVIVTWGEMLGFTLRLGSSVSAPNDYHGVAFDDLGWGASTPVTSGETFTLSYDGNGSGGGTVPASQTSGVGGRVTVASNSGLLTKTGHTFAGWNTAANGSGSTYLAGSSFVMPQGGDVLYAVWTPTNYTVSYNANGGTGAPASQTVAFGATVTAAAQGSTARTGYTFNGWNTAANGSGTSYTAGTGTFSMPASNTVLYARWTINQYTLTYDANDGTGAPSPQTADAGTTVTVAAAGSMTRTGHTFAGWNTAANGTGTARAVASTFALNEAVTLYAQWTVNQRTVTYNANGGTGAPASETKAYNSTVTVASAGSMTRAGHDFAGWNTAANGTGTARAAAATFSMPDANVTLYAQWTARQHDVIYAANDTGLGSTATNVPSTQANNNYGSSVTVSATAPSLAGYTFNGWNTAANGTGTSYLAGDSVTQPDADVTLHAQWVADIYDLIYNANGGTGAPDPGQYGTGSQATVSATAPTRTGYEFAGWNTAANGSGTNRSAGDTFTMPPTDVTLYAKWTVRSFSVTYYGNGGGGFPGSQSVQYGATATVAAQGSTARAGYSFTGWNTVANGSGTAWSGGSTFAMPAANVSLYAQWTADLFTVSYDANGGSGAPARQVAGTDSIVTSAAAGSMTRAGYSFSEWNTSADGTGTQRLASGTFAMPAANVTLYAQWTATVNTVTYSANGGNGAPGSSTAPTDATFTVSGVTPTRTGYTFGGWNTAANGSGTDYGSGDTFTMPTTNLTLYAKWTPNVYVVSYDANGGSGAPGNQNQATASTVTISATVPVRAGYSLTAWNSAANGSGTVYVASGTFTMPATNVTLYAQWTADSQRISYNANGGTGAPANASAVTDATFTVSATVPNRTGYTFAGWNTAADGSGTAQAASSTLTVPASDVTLYAQWSIRSYTITYDANGGSSAPAGAVEQYLANATLSATPAVYVGYTFNGWNTAANGSGTSYLAGATFRIPASDTTLYAQWEPEINDLLYNANGGTGAPSAGQFGTGQTATVSATLPTRTGYTFAGWNTAADGSGTARAANATFTMPVGDVFLFAQWTAVSYTLSYSVNDGSGSAPASVSATYGDSIVVAQPTGVTRAGHTFAGWNTAANGSGTDHAATQTLIMPADNVTLYAQWQANLNAIVFNAAGGSGAPSPTFVATAQSTTLTTDVPTKTGHSFTGWVDSQGTAVDPGDTYTMGAANTMLFAQWSINSYTLSYDANGGSGAPSQETKVYDTTVTVSATAPTRSGHNFAGWNTAQNGSGTARAAGATFAMPGENTTLFAQWTAIPVVTTTAAAPTTTVAVTTTTVAVTTTTVRVTTTTAPVTASSLAAAPATTTTVLGEAKAVPSTGSGSDAVATPTAPASTTTSTVPRAVKRPKGSASATVDADTDTDPLASAATDSSTTTMPGSDGPGDDASTDAGDSSADDGDASTDGGASAPTDSGSGSGTAWMWWVALAVAGVAGGGWWIAARKRRRR